MLKRDWLTLEPRFIDRNICFCDGGGDTGGDQPDGVTFTSGDDYTPGQGVQISSDTLAARSTDDTYGGFNTSPARQAEIFGTGTYNDPYESGSFASPNLGYVSGVTGDAEFTGVPSVTAPSALGALASQDASFNLSPAASPLQNLTAEQKAIVETARMMGETPPDFSRPMTEAEKARDKQLTDIFSETNLDPATGQEAQRARNEQQIADRAAAIDAINAMTGITRAGGATARDVLGSGISALDFDPNVGFGEFDSTVTGPMSRPQVQGPPRMPDQVYDFDTRPDTVTDQQLADQIMASSQGVDRDAEVVSALSDDFLDERGRQDVNVLGEKIADYFNNPLVEAGQQLERFSPIGALVRGVTGQPSAFTDKAGLPSFGSLGDMTKAVQAGGRLTTDESGNPLFVTMPDGSTVGAPSQPSSLMTGGGGGGGSAPKSPMDPCPPGYKMVDGVCQPTGQEEGGGFQMGSGVGDTRFSPFYTPQQVSDVNPFVLRPYR